MARDLARVGGGFAETGGFTADQPLFRPEALAAASTSGFGKPIALFPVSWTVMSVSLLVMVTLCGGVLALGNYTRKESVVGVVRTVGGETRVVASAPGVVSQMNVREGAAIKAGQPIMSVATVRIGVDGQPDDAKALESIDREIDDLATRLEALKVGTAIDEAGGSAKLRSLRSERSAASRIEAAGRERLVLAEQALERIEPVAKNGFISGDAMLRRRVEIISIRQSIAESQAREAALDGQIAELTAGQGRRPFVLIQERGQLLDLISRARREKATMTAQHGYVVRAPATGTVTALQVAVGQSVEPQRPLMTITAPARSMLAEVYVPSRAIGFLQLKQRVTVRYDAFPYQRFGAARGTISAISGTVLRPDEVQAAVEVKEPMYRVLVKLEQTSLRAYGKTYPIQPGFALRADILLDERSFGEWLLDPIVALRGRL